MDISRITFPDSVRIQLGIKTEQHATQKMGSILGRAKPEILEIYKALPLMLPRSVLDIGCGLAAKTLLLALQYPSIRRIHLIDGDGTAQHQGGYKPSMEAWSNVWQGQDFVQHNLLAYSLNHVVVTASLPQPVGMGKNEWDLIVSFRALGHHFSVDMYMDTFKRELAPNGYIILDIRNNTPGEALMEAAGFKRLLRIPDTSNKCQRLVFRHA